jgi:hypothetical protein
VSSIPSLIDESLKNLDQHSSLTASIKDARLLGLTAPYDPLDECIATSTLRPVPIE